MNNRQKNYTGEERAIARSIIKSDGIKAGLSAKIILRVGKKHIATKVKITGKLKGAAQNRKNSLQENTVAMVEKQRREEKSELTTEFYQLTSRAKKKLNCKTLQDYLNLKATY